MMKPLVSARTAATSICWNMMTKGDVAWWTFWSSRYISARLAESRSRAAASALFVISGMSQALRQASGLDWASSELSGLRAKVSELVLGSVSYGPHWSMSLWGLSARDL